MKSYVFKLSSFWKSNHMISPNRNSIYKKYNKTKNKIQSYRIILDSKIVNEIINVIINPLKDNTYNKLKTIIINRTTDFDNKKI